ncbi:transposase [Cronbergia sp. UHCC 0137]|uniref:transposase n=1 Tax=Cronbergia sp. UHCC 0137 TaxID=3110239 RepID=UPI002B214F82|nr:transposase [Cronbergia sp. UHCC 0137]MEA5617215.1 transposase [Cronbergia sp. UHCC 0137]
MAVAIMPDHVHNISRSRSSVWNCKINSIHEFSRLKSRLPTLWTNSYFVSNVGGVPILIIKQYIENQKND